ncbi:MAG: hypothetical protein HY928_16195 [Elusimicrobia bacterium]|nr:hypothetical protein [Elusimicrobiota bacterium]
MVLRAGINSKERGVVASADPGDKSVFWDMGTIGKAGHELHGAAWERMDWAVQFCPFCGKPKKAAMEAA